MMEEVSVAGEERPHPCPEIASFINLASPEEEEEKEKELEEEVPPPPPRVELCRRGYSLRELRPLFRFRNYSGGHARWKRWARMLHCKHERTWKDAGIYEAIGCSEYETLQDPDVIIALAERWCSRTNTFVFPWGEATVTLEDVNVLGGFSLLGDSVAAAALLGSGQDDFGIESDESEEVLGSVFREICVRTCQVPRTRQWMERFEGGEFEHEAFIALWLSRFVFPNLMDDAVNRNVIPLAIRLSKGQRIALAPAVLAGVYKALSDMKWRVLTVPLDRLLKLYEPLHLVQVWAWERFPELLPGNSLLKYPDVPRIALWVNVSRRNKKQQNVRLALDTAGDSFVWRPFLIPTNGWLVHPLFADEERCVSLGSLPEHMARDFEGYIRCMRVSELVGFGGFLQQYLPHRVVMQFGLNQDLPKVFPRQKTGANDIAAWDYSRPLGDSEIYIPSRISRSCLTTRYLDWWGKSVQPQMDQIGGVVIRKPRGLRKSRKRNNSQGEHIVSDSMNLDTSDDLTLDQVVNYKQQLKESRLLQDEPDQINEGVENERVKIENEALLGLFKIRRQLEKEAEEIRESNLVVSSDEAVSNQDQGDVRYEQDDYQNMMAKIEQLEAGRGQLEQR